jgi:putative acetyltransferase
MRCDDRGRHDATLRIDRADFTDAGLHAFLQAHLDDMEPTTPPESQHALDLAGLQRPGVRMWVATDATDATDATPTVVGTIALAPVRHERNSDGRHGVHEELKSMRTDPAHRGSGIATRLLRHALDDARERQVTRISLETGSVEFFAPARALYRKSGFADCAPFGAYLPDPNSTFMTLPL